MVRCCRPLSRLFCAARRLRGPVAALVLALVAGGCGGPRLQAVRPGAPATLEALTREFWEEEMRNGPLWATSLGDHRRDAELGRASSAERERHNRALQNLAGRLDLVNRKDLDDDGRVTADLLAFQLTSAVAVDQQCRIDLWVVDQLGGPQVSFAELPNYHKVVSAKAGADLVSRYQQMDEYFRDVVANLREGLRRGLVAPKGNVERVIRQIEEELAVPVEASPFVATVLEGLEKSPGDAWKARLLAAVQQSVYGGLKAYHDFLKTELLPHAREAVGVGALSIGRACYAAEIESATGLKLDPEDVFKQGEAEVERITKEMEALVKASGGKDVATYLHDLPLRKDQYLDSPAALLDYNRELMTRALRALPRAFGHLPRTVIEVKAIESFRDKDAPIAYYYQAPEDGSRPAYYYVNTFAAGTRVLNKMPALAFHEAVPGHHLQIALANENRNLPAFQRQMGVTAFIEGWALYAEGLADELGLYRTADEKMGQLAFEIWRAARLVVDTAMHAKGWSRQQAIDYMVAKTGIRVEEVQNEVDRYITWPGQALAYKTGELEIRKLRAYAQAKLGARFDLRAFHDHLLAHGAVTLPTARTLIEAWVASVQASP